MNDPQIGTREKNGSRKRIENRFEHSSLGGLNIEQFSNGARSLQTGDRCPRALDVALMDHTVVQIQRARGIFEIGNILRG